MRPARGLVWAHSFQKRPGGEADLGLSAEKKDVYKYERGIQALCSFFLLYLKFPSSMKACIHVDYLSHEWTASDAIRAYSQVRKEIRKLKSKQRSSNPFDAKAQRALRVENQLLTRFENALWRQMSRTCTPLLGGHNPMVHPSTVNW